MTVENRLPRPRMLGCAWSILIINGLVIGLAALSFSQGPYSSAEQELWYRYGSLALLAVGVILPGLLLLLGARRRPWAVSILIIWMVAAFAAFLVYAFYGGGGV